MSFIQDMLDTVFVIFVYKISNNNTLQKGYGSLWQTRKNVKNEWNNYWNVKFTLLYNIFFIVVESHVRKVCKRGNTRDFVSTNTFRFFSNDYFLDVFTLNINGKPFYTKLKTNIYMQLFSKRNNLRNSLNSSFINKLKNDENLP
jgi:hypothetical protein